MKKRITPRDWLIRIAARKMYERTASRDRIPSIVEETVRELQEPVKQYYANASDLALKRLDNAVFKRYLYLKSFDSD